MHRDEEEFDVGQLPLDPSGGLDSTATGHHDVRHDQIGFQLEREFDQSIAIASGTDTVEMWIQQALQATQGKWVIVGNQDSNLVRKFATGRLSSHGFSF